MNKELNQCPFCGVSMRIESNLDWHRLVGDHEEKCVFMERETMMVPASDDQLVLMIEDWNTRATPPAAQVQGERERERAVHAAFNDWSWNKKGEAVGRMDGQAAAYEGFHAGAEWQSRAALSAPPAAGWTRAELHDDISGDFEGYCWIDGRTGQRHWLPRGVNPNEKEPTRANGGPHRCLFAPEGWACIKQAQHDGPCMAVKLTDGECHAAPPAAGVPDDCVEPYGWVAAGRFFLDRDQAVEAAEKTPCVEVYSRPQMLATSLTTPASEQQQVVVLPDDAFKAEFMTWWEEHGQYCRAGGGNYERSFAFEAWRHLYPRLIQASLNPPLPGVNQGVTPEAAEQGQGDE